MTDYVHALRFRFLTPLYDAVVAIGMRERQFKRQVLQLAGICGGLRVLDFGCGTGTLTIMGCQLHPGAEFVGVDGDSAILAIARRKASAARVGARFDHAFVSALPYGDSSFDCVVSSLLFHHLKPSQKREAVAEVRRVLRPKGVFVVGDFGAPAGPWARLASAVLSRFDGVDNTRDNFEGRLPVIIREGGFDVEECAHVGTAFGTVRLLRGVPASAN